MGVIDRGNSTGFVVPIALAYFVALSRQRWGLATITVILAVLVKPQFVVLGVVLLAARQWRWAGIGITGVVVSNIAAFCCGHEVSWDDRTVDPRHHQVQ